MLLDDLSCMGEGPLAPAAADPQAEIIRIVFRDGHVRRPRTIAIRLEARPTPHIEAQMRRLLDRHPTSLASRALPDEEWSELHRCFEQSELWLPPGPSATPDGADDVPTVTFELVRAGRYLKLERQGSELQHAPKGHSTLEACMRSAMASAGVMP